MQSEKFHHRLIRIRKRRRLTVGELTSRLGIPPSTYRAWEYGRAIQGPEAFVRLAKAFEVSLDELMAGAVPRLAPMIGKLDQAERLLVEIRQDLLSQG